MIKSIKNHCRWLFGKLNIFGNLAAENIALRQQLIVLKRNQKRPVLKERDRLFWVLLSRIWSGWRDAVYIVQPDTVVRWHKKPSNSIGVASPNAVNGDDHQQILKFVPSY